MGRDYDVGQRSRGHRDVIIKPVDAERKQTARSTGARYLPHTLQGGWPAGPASICISLRVGVARRLPLKRGADVEGGAGADSLLPSSSPLSSLPPQQQQPQQRVVADSAIVMTCHAYQRRYVI